MCLSAAHLTPTNSDSQATNPFDRLVYRAAKRITSFEIADGKRDFWVPVIQKLVLNLSDQQLLTGLAVLIAGFWTHCTISVYHFALVNDLAWFSASVHLTTLTVLQDYLVARPALRNWRTALMVVVALLLVASTVMEGHYEWFDSWPYDAQCLFDNLIGNIGGSPRYWMFVGLALICSNYLWSIIPLFKRPRNFFRLWLKKKPKAARDLVIERLDTNMSLITSSSPFKDSMKRFGCTLSIKLVSAIGWVYFALYAFTGSQTCNLAMDTFWFAYSLWSIMADRAIPASEMNGNENAMTFGQILPILLLSSIVLVFGEAYIGMPSRLHIPPRQLTSLSDQKKEMEEEMPSSSHSSQLSLMHTRSSTAGVPTASQSFEMAGAMQNAADDSEPQVSFARRVDTEMGGRSQASGLEGSPSEREPQRRPTFPPTTDMH